jgi:putative ATP-dependent endonuclease of the OLD family
MKLEKVIIEGFRSYRERREISVGQLTAFIGENDIGKSTILEALDAFFNDNADPQDVNTLSAEKSFTIGCVFSDLPEQINLDANSQTTLADEYLLNSDGKLEIYKVWKATTIKAEVERIFALANAPMAEEAQGLLFKKRAELREIVNQKGIEANKNYNPDMRAKIYAHLEAQGLLALQDREVELDRPKDKNGQFEDARRIWKKLSDRHLPVYELFKSEQVRGDKEAAVRSPLDATLKAAIRELETEFAPIAEKIEKQVAATTERTLERLRQDYPEVARNLVPQYKSPTWSKAFDLDVLRGDDDVPLNKRGAGVRRLVVLAFFQAEAEKKRQERAEGAVVPPVIYAIEEPETSQHPDFQRNIIRALEALADAGDQVLLTTHVPGLAELLPTDSIRFIDKPEGASTPRIRNGGDNKSVLVEAARSLGVLPNAIPAQGAQVAIWVEGDTDVWVLDSFVGKLANAGRLPAQIEAERIYYVVGGSGDKLKAFINGEYLGALGLPQFYLRDSDKEAPDHEGKEIPAEVMNRVKAWKERGEGVPIAVVLTRKREIENYLDHSVIDRVAGHELNLPSRIGDINWDFMQICKETDSFWVAVQAAKVELGFHFPAQTRRGVEVKHLKPKHVICGVLIPEMTMDEIVARCASTDDPDQDFCEVEGWFRDMAELINAAHEST